ncbi:MAG: hypothetical protein MJ247_06720 [Alphaproteobacteria bacterium]|nr:hypothetical protein [Alphaproteobacteria bacterium]
MSLQEELQNALEDLGRAVSEVSKFIDVLKRERQTSFELREKLVDANQKIDSMDKENKSVKNIINERDQLKIQVENLTSYRNRLAAEKNALLSEREQFKKTKIDLEKDKEFSTKKISELEEQISLLKEGKEIPEEIAKQDNLEKENEELKNRIKELEDSNKEHIKNNEQLSVERDGLQKAYDEIKNDMKLASTKLDSVLKEMKILKGDANA